MQKWLKHEHTPFAHFKMIVTDVSVICRHFEHFDLFFFLTLKFCSFFSDVDHLICVSLFDILIIIVKNKYAMRNIVNVL